MPRATRRCGAKGCDNPMPCKAHARKPDRRPSSSKRGYDHKHRAERTSWEPTVATGTVKCRRDSNGTCLKDDPYIAPGTPWDLGHPDVECPAPTGPEHEQCNRATVNRAGRRTA